MSADCLFCRIVRGEIPAKLVAESDDCVAFRDIDPKAPTHLLVIPRAHVASLNEATDEALLGKVMRFAADVARQEGIADSGWRTVVNTGPDAQQSVFHLHVHVMGGRKFHWPPG
ncbi:histidine triad (HIT) protein [Gemmatirosa kalamazoonensis]|uniref:Histidine triad (HIT) protein n=1 Tax=Gemmatirosa kalamazoonensis TaxID=861299 RepID=W0RKN6_9BACT|nr:histidine triad nucleotide-binding protein [Gemmatirosa kalamazoonensis]AHG91002.1 histidine triad (HIT) protein [Gemmatirosa kalamazoonensis]